MVAVYSDRLSFERGLVDFMNLFLYDHRETLRSKAFDSEEIYSDFYHKLQDYLDIMRFTFVEEAPDLRRILNNVTLDVFEDALVKIRGGEVPEDAC